MDTTSWNENTGEPRVWKLTRAVRGRAGGKGPSSRYLACCPSYYDLGESLPDHSSLTKIRTSYGIEVFRRFFEAIVEHCQDAGLVWGRELCAIRSLETMCSLIRGISGYEPKGTLITTRLMLDAIPNLLGESRQRSPEGLDWPSIRKAGENEDKR